MSWKTRFVFGCRVVIDGDQSLVGCVTAFMWRPAGRLVEVSWVHNGALNTEWIDEFRLSEAA